MLSIREINKMPVNCAAARMVRLLGREPNPEQPHCFELVLWHLGEGKDDLEVDGSVVETLRAMVAWLPQRIMNFLQLLPGQEYDPEGWTEARTPVELAKVVLKDIEEKIYDHFPWYGSFEQ